jgi:hypothetical protein
MIQCSAKIAPVERTPWTGSELSEGLDCSGTLPKTWMPSRRLPLDWTGLETQQGKQLKNKFAQKRCGFGKHDKAQA